MRSYQITRYCFGLFHSFFVNFILWILNSIVLFWFGAVRKRNRQKKTILGKIITISQAFQIYEIYLVAFIQLLLPLLYFLSVKFYKRNLFYFKSHSFRQVLWSIKWIEIHKTTNKYHSYDNWNYYYWLVVYAFAILYRVSKLLLFIALNQYFTWFDFW